MQRLIYNSIKKYIPEQIELPVHADELTIRELQRINSKPGGDGVHIPGFWKKVEELW